MAYRYFYRVFHLNGLGEVEEILEWFSKTMMTRRQFHERVEWFANSEAHDGKYGKSVVYLSIGSFEYDEQGYMPKKTCDEAEMHRVCDYTAFNVTGIDCDTVVKLLERHAYNPEVPGETGYNYTFYADTDSVKEVN